jgi:hypothetical protein
MFLSIAIAILTVFFSARAESCSATVEVSLKTLHPTQFEVGEREVQRKQEKLAALSPSEMQDKINNHLVQIVRGPRGVDYIVDGHHFALALLRMDIAVARAEVLADFSLLDEQDFWRQMHNNRWAYLYQAGIGPLPPQSLPRYLNDLPDDPYRSLASAVRRARGYDRPKSHFSELKWANFFRQHLVIENGEEGFAKAVQQGIVLAHSQLAFEFSRYVDGDCADLLER